MDKPTNKEKLIFVLNVLLGLLLLFAGALGYLGLINYVLGKSGDGGYTYDAIQIDANNKASNNGENENIKLTSFIEMYEINKYIGEDNNIKIELNEIEDKVYRIRIHNTSEDYYMVNSLGLNTLNMLIITQNNTIQPKKHGDFYLATKNKLKKEVFLKLTINSIYHEILMNKIEYNPGNYMIYELKQL